MTIGPLEGTIVVELSDSASAPFAGKILAELGATVWKVERPTGDSARGWGPSTLRGSGAAFHALNRGKRTICVDIKAPAELERLRRLIVQDADVFLHNLRPGTSARYGLDAATLRTQKPDLVHCEVGAFGNAGPLREAPGYDPLMQAFAGIMSLTGEEAQPPVRAGVSIVDFGTGMWAVIGILTSLLHRERSGTGAAVSGSLLETAITWMTIGVGNYEVDGEPGGRFGSGVAFIAPHRAFATADGYLVVSAANDVIFRQLCEGLGHPEWADDPRFRTNGVRLQHRAELDRVMGDVLSTASRAEWQQRLGRAGVPTAPVQTTPEMAEHPQTAALGILHSAEEGDPPMVGLPLSFDGARPRVAFGAHEVGAHDDELRRALENGTP